MYNRYVRDADGNYTRMTVEDADMSFVPSPPPQNRPGPIQPPPPPGGHMPPGPGHPPPRPAPPPAGHPFQHLLQQIHLDDVDSGDLLLLFLLFFLFRRDADEELLIALGLLLIL